jgi:ATP-dependent 26S proteasome regulatory subunit
MAIRRDDIGGIMLDEIDAIAASRARARDRGAAA